MSAAAGRGLSEALLRDMGSKSIDAKLTLSILEDYNSGLYDSVGPVEAAGVPAIDGLSVVSLAVAAGCEVADGGRLQYAVDSREARERLGALGLGIPPSAREGGGGETLFDATALEAVGNALLGRTAFGVLNGGSATSYADSKKNLAFGQDVFEALAPAYERLAPLCKDEPKGLTPAYLQPNGSPGESFLLLKMRARLVAARRAKERGEKLDDSFMPLFQMTSVSNDARVAQAYEEYRAIPYSACSPASWA